MKTMKDTSPRSLRTTQNQPHSRLFCKLADLSKVKSLVFLTKMAPALISTSISSTSHLLKMAHSVSRRLPTNPPSTLLTKHFSRLEYHIHVNPIPEDGNCSGAGGHLSPYGRQDTPECDADDPTTCQPGDLSGKHGAIDNTAEEKNFQRSYLDLYLSTNPESASFFGNRSVVVHAQNGTRLNCANFTQQWSANNGSDGYGGGNGPEVNNPVNGGGGTNNDTHNGSGTATNASTGGAGGMIKIFKPELALALALALGYALFLL
jgi:hypothetical protein